MKQRQHQICEECVEKNTDEMKQHEDEQDEG